MAKTSTRRAPSQYSSPLLQPECNRVVNSMVRCLHHACEDSSSGAARTYYGITTSFQSVEISNSHRRGNGLSADTDLLPDSYSDVAEEMPQGKVLVTGGAGYIGSHVALELLEAGYSVTIVDNLSNSNIECIHRLHELSGCSKDQLSFHEADVRDQEKLDEIFSTEGPIDHVIHCAGLKSVAESIKSPELYADVNVRGTQVLLEAMHRHHCSSIIFSSSATVYGVGACPYREISAVGNGIAHPYGETKLAAEQLLEQHSKSPKGIGWSIVVLRYFNPVGAHPSGRIGEDPLGTPNNLMPYMTQVLVGRRPMLTIFGSDFDTPDGTCVRDFIHVVDLAKGHVAALKKVEKDGHSRTQTKPHRGSLSVYNLGRGEGVSVKQMVQAMERATGLALKHKVGPRRDGDSPEAWANVELANKELNWKATLSLEEICRDAWNWQHKNPSGYRQAKSKMQLLQNSPEEEATEDGDAILIKEGMQDARNWQTWRPLPAS